MPAETTGYILTEIWNARPAWLALSKEERSVFFEKKVGPYIADLQSAGATFLGCAINDNSGPERIDYRYMAVWKLPDKAFSDLLEAGARDMGFLEYFDQANFSGQLITPEIMNTDMTNL